MRFDVWVEVRSNGKELRIGFNLTKLQAERMAEKARRNPVYFMVWVDEAQTKG